MSHPTGRSPDSKARTHRPHTTRPRLHRPHSLDPVSTARRRPLFTGGNIALFTFSAFFGLYAKGHLAGFDRFFDRVHAFGRAHNDVVVRGIVHWLPATLVVSAAAALATMTFYGLRDRFGRRRSFAGVDDKALKAALASAVRASARRTSSMVRTHPAEPAQATPGKRPQAQPAVTIHPFFTQQRLQRREAAKLRGETLSAEAAGDAAAAQPAAAQAPAEIPSPVRPLSEAMNESLSDSPPTLPVHHRVRRRDPRGTLPPAIAAALKQQVAANSAAK